MSEQESEVDINELELRVKNLELYLGFPNHETVSPERLNEYLRMRALLRMDPCIIRACNPCSRGMEADDPQEGAARFGELGR